MMHGPTHIRYWKIVFLLTKTREWKSSIYVVVFGRLFDCLPSMVQFLAKLHLQDESIVLSSSGEVVSACCYSSYTIVKELHGATEAYRSWNSSLS